MQNFRSLAQYIFAILQTSIIFIPISVLVYFLLGIFSTTINFSLAVAIGAYVIVGLPISWLLVETVGFLNKINQEEMERAEDSY